MTALQPAPAAEDDEPAAWEIEYQGGIRWVTNYREKAEAYRDARHTVTPLYRRPAPSPTVDRSAILSEAANRVRDDAYVYDSDDPSRVALLNVADVLDEMGDHV